MSAKSSPVLDFLRYNKPLAAVIAAVIVLAAVAAFAFTTFDVGSLFSAPPEAAASAAPTRKQRFIVMADRLCAAADRKTEKLLPPDSAATVGPYVQGVVRIHGKLLKRLRRLSMPKQDRALLRRYFSRVQAFFPWARELGGAAAAGDTLRVSELLREGRRLHRRLDLAALRYGFKECSDSD